MVFNIFVTCCLSYPFYYFRKRLPRYFGDCSTDDMKSPTKARRNWKIIKKTILEQRIKISKLQRENRYLKSKVYSLNSLLTYLRDNHFITESAEAVIEVSVPIKILFRLFIYQLYFLKLHF